MSEEQVLVFPESRLRPFLNHFRDKVVTEPAIIEDVLDWVLCEPRFMPRSEAERDPSHKQVIPYCLLRRGPEYFCYLRSPACGEASLRDKWSLGVGGHVNDEDLDYEGGVRRELTEEVGLELGIDLFQEAPVVALIYDPSDVVGEVHFGVVHLVDVGEPPPVPRDPAIAEYRWLTGEWIADVLALENWSELLLRRFI